METMYSTGPSCDFCLWRQCILLVRVVTFVSGNNVFYWSGLGRLSLETMYFTSPGWDVCLWKQCILLVRVVTFIWRQCILLVRVVISVSGDKVFYRSSFVTSVSGDNVFYWSELWLLSLATMYSTGPGWGFCLWRKCILLVRVVTFVSGENALYWSGL